MPLVKSLITPVDRDAPALDHHPGLARRDHDRRGAVALGGGHELERDRHLADRAVGADRQDDPLAGQMAAAEVVSIRSGVAGSR